MITLPRSQKITPIHLERKAVVYIRQSTTKQVRTNTESQRNQRALSERAQALGWPKERIVILDGDLGRSGAIWGDLGPARPAEMTSPRSRLMWP